MRIQTTDPMNGIDVKDTENAPFVIEGNGDDALKIYFTDLQSLQAYLDIETDQLGTRHVEIYNRSTGVSMEM